MTTSAIAFVVALVAAVLLMLYYLRRFDAIKIQPLYRADYTKKDDITQNHWVINSVGDNVVLTAGESHDIIEFAFIWDLLNDVAEQAEAKKTLFIAKQLIIDLSQSKYMGHISCEYHMLSKQYEEAKGKPIIFCGINQHLHEIFDLLQCQDILPSLFEFPTLKEALRYCENYSN
jgi:anti-anti-sigma regulatory factor